MDVLKVVFEPVPGASSSSLSSSCRSKSSTRESSSTAADNSDMSEKTSTSLARPRRRPIPRKGHTKSRGGCFNCKRRKVKCQETLPECNHCKRIGLKCEYPSQIAPSYALQTRPTTTFTMDDLRFFQHFLLKAYPALPIHGAAIWRDVAQISHGFEYLVHSMLGLAASSLALTAHPSSSYLPAALSHRTTAIRLLNSALSKPCSCPEEGTARYAAIMALTFQSSYMADGMLEFVSMTRGCHVIAHTAMAGAFEESPFGVFSREGHVDAVRTFGPKPAREVDQQEDQALGEEIVEGLQGGLRDFATLCGERSKLEDQVLLRVQRAVALARRDCMEAFNEVTIVYELLGHANHDEFFPFVDSANFPAQILLVYFFLVEYLVAYHAMSFIRSSFAYRTETTRLWITNLAAKLPEKYEQYMEWPLKFAESLI